MKGNKSGSGSDMEISSGSENEVDDDLVKRPGFKEDELSDSATSTELSYTQTSDGYHSSRLSPKVSHNQETTTKEHVVGRDFHREKFYSHDTPSASSLLGSRLVINQCANSTSRQAINVLRQTKNIFLAEDNTGSGMHNPSVRSVKAVFFFLFGL